MIQIQVPARICFYGDHQDYLGLPVIAGAIDRYIHITARPNTEEKFVLKLLDLEEEEFILLDDDLKNVQPGDFFRSAMAVLKNEGFRYQQGYTVEISGNIPVNAGLSSSSALLVAWIRFLVAINGKLDETSDFQVGRWAYKAEVVFFDSPGGLMDQYTIAQRGLLYIDTESGKSERLVGDMGQLLVAESGLAKKTLEVLKNARVFAQNAVDAVKRNHPEFVLKESVLDDYEKYLESVPHEFRDHWYAAIHNYQITLAAKKELQKELPNLRKLGDLMNRHQKILEEQIQNTPVEMVRMMEAAIGAGAIGAKTIGSGGGGCMVAMVTGEVKEAVRQAFLDAGAKAVYEVEITA
ncbi:galactokinase family protein [Flagellimonas amoyensis]|uniref:GHMP family kinase ATP-binding protein n=1 Tax=Flagellimonas amoyensis TaxID=2169401 RepID=UPI000D3CDB1B|nr:galactokinase family protein [Allomuricauda amoyensis]